MFVFGSWLNHLSGGRTDSYRVFFHQHHHCLRFDVDVKSLVGNLDLYYVYIMLYNSMHSKNDTQIFTPALIYFECIYIYTLMVPFLAYLGEVVCTAG